MTTMTICIYCRSSVSRSLRQEAADGECEDGSSFILCLNHREHTMIIMIKLKVIIKLAAAYRSRINSLTES